MPNQPIVNGPADAPLCFEMLEAVRGDGAPGLFLKGEAVGGSKKTRKNRLFSAFLDLSILKQDKILYSIDGAMRASLSVADHEAFVRNLCQELGSMDKVRPFLDELLVTLRRTWAHSDIVAQWRRLGIPASEREMARVPRAMFLVFEDLGFGEIKDGIFHRTPRREIMKKIQRYGLEAVVKSSHAWYLEKIRANA